jgi:hypothetical protein
LSYYDGDPWSNHQLKEIKCGSVGKSTTIKRERAISAPPVKRKRERNK